MCEKCRPARELAADIAERMNSVELCSAEKTREFYRRQGEKRERERIKKQLHEYGEDPIESKLDDFLRIAIDAESNDSLAKGSEWGAKDERARIIRLLVKADTTHLTTEGLKGWYFALGLIEGETNG